MRAFGRYQLDRLVGTGGMAEIWRARAMGPGGFEKILAIKKVLKVHLEDEDFIKMFVEEAKLCAGLVHPNIVQVFDFGRVDEDYFIAMEYVPGTNLSQLARRMQRNNIPVPLEVAVYIVAESARGLHFAHEKTDNLGSPLNIVHRDVSPQNILVSFGGEVKVTDFGIAKASGTVSRTAAGHVKGKLRYMSPEQASLGNIDCRSDIFALGIVLYELVTGKKLFEGASGEDVYSKVVSFAPLTNADMPKVPDELRDIIRHALAPRAGDRYRNAGEFEQDLANLIGMDAFMQSRQALAAFVRRMFADELREESQPSIPALTAALGASAAAVPETPTTSSPSGSMQVIQGALATAKPEANTVVTPGPSLLTLASQQNPVRVGPQAAPAALPVAAPVARVTPKAAPIALYAAIGVVVLGAAGIGWKLGSPARDAATPTPTTLVVAAEPTPTPTPVGSVAATATPTATIVAIASAVRTAQPIRTVQPARTAPTPVRTVAFAATPVPTPRPAAATGRLNVRAKPWVEVWIDGTKVAKDTPLKNFAIEGKHLFKFVNPDVGFTIERTLVVPRDGTLQIFVDVATKEVRVE